MASISSGDLLRDNVRQKTSLGTYIREICRRRHQANEKPGLQAESLMREGALVPDNLMLNLIASSLRSRGWLTKAATTANTGTTATIATTAQTIPQAATTQTASNASSAAQFASYTTSASPTASFILDGFPRTAAQATSLDALIPINLVVHLVTPVPIILSRIASRWIHAPSGRVYNTTFNAPKVPGKDDITGEALTQREDDSEATWTQRLKKFEATSQPLLQHYADKGVLWRVEGDSSDEISPKLFEEIEKRFGP